METALGALVPDVMLPSPPTPVLETIATDVPLTTGDPLLGFFEGGAYARIFKPALDLVMAAVLVLLTLPIVIGLALAVRAKLGPKVIFRQERVGRNGQVFTIYKLRSMAPDRRARCEPFEGEDRRQCHKTGDDPRHTPFGRFLRNWSLDELPQLWNVVLGHMSLVGPRPEMASVVDRYQLWAHPRHLVKPGLTGLWQVSELRAGLLHENVHVDVDYVQRVSLLTDLKILWRTITALSSRRHGA